MIPAVQKALTVCLSLFFPFVGLCASVFWDSGSLSYEGSSWDGTKENYFWTLEMGDWYGGGEAAYMSIGFSTSLSSSRVTISPGEMDIAAAKWAKRVNSGDLITIEAVRQNFFDTNTGEGDNHDSSFRI